MDEFVLEIHATIESYKERANHAFKHGDIVAHVLVAEENGYPLRTTFPRPHFFQPPTDFEKDHGFTGIAGNYVMPKGLNHVELQAYGEILRHAELVGDISPETMNDKFDQLLGVLAARNPQIATIKPGEDKLAKYNIVLGIASEFNPKDIQFFLDSYPEMSKYTETKYEKMFTRLSHLNISWIPHPDTLEKIEHQYKAQQAAKLVVEAAQVPVAKTVSAKTP